MTLRASFTFGCLQFLRDDRSSPNFLQSFFSEPCRPGYPQREACQCSKSAGRSTWQRNECEWYKFTAAIFLNSLNRSFTAGLLEQWSKCCGVWRGAAVADHQKGHCGGQPFLQYFHHHRCHHHEKGNRRVQPFLQHYHQRRYPSPPLHHHHQSVMCLNNIFVCIQCIDREVNLSTTSTISTTKTTRWTNTWTPPWEIEELICWARLTSRLLRSRRAQTADIFFINYQKSIITDCHQMATNKLQLYHFLQLICFFSSK